MDGPSIMMLLAHISHAFLLVVEQSYEVESNKRVILATYCVETLDFSYLNLRIQVRLICNERRLSTISKVFFSFQDLERGKSWLLNHLSSFLVTVLHAVVCSFWDASGRYGYFEFKNESIRSWYVRRWLWNVFSWVYLQLQKFIRPLLPYRCLIIFLSCLVLRGHCTEWIIRLRQLQCC